MNVDQKIGSVSSNASELHTSVALDLQKLEKLISQLNNSLLKLAVDRGQYDSEVSACNGLCKEIQELMNDTKRVTTNNER